MWLRVVALACVWTAVWAVLTPHASPFHRDSTQTPGFDSPIVVGTLHTGGKLPIVVYLHSLGEDTSFVQREMTLLKEVATFVLPRPEVRALQSRSGLRLRAWYDVPTRSFSRAPDSLVGYHASALYLVHLVNELLALQRPVYVIGLSQGAAMAFSIAFGETYSAKLTKPLSGVIMFGGYLIQEKLNPTLGRTTAARWAHSPDDQQVNYRSARMAFADLRKMSGYDGVLWVDLKSSNHRLQKTFTEMMEITMDFASAGPLPYASVDY